MTNYKVVVLDMDDTLLNSDNECDIRRNCKLFNSNSR